MAQSLQEMLLLNEYAKRLIHSLLWLYTDADIGIDSQREVGDKGAWRRTANSWEVDQLHTQVSACGIFGATRKSGGRQVGRVKDRRERHVYA